MKSATKKWELDGQEAKKTADGSGGPSGTSHRRSAASSPLQVIPTLGQRNSDVVFDPNLHRVVPEYFARIVCPDLKLNSSDVEALPGLSESRYLAVGFHQGQPSRKTAPP
jgi:hypothetical protein